MRQVEAYAVIPAVPAEVVFDGIRRFDRYPHLARHVQATTVHEAGDSAGRSSWELHFRSGLLRWTEHERFLSNDLRLEFEQTSGDFETFAGQWQLEPLGEGTRLAFGAEFDFGIPSMEGILDPIAARVIKETVHAVVVGMFEHVELVDGLRVDVPDTVDTAT
jgi:ribosome-associated toxin RatA of RatAB toxin-antitoxin module